MTALSIEQRIARLEDARAIEEVKYQYAAYCDSGYDLDGICSVFTPDGRWSANGFGDFTGHAEIRAFFANLARSVTRVRHYVTSPRLRIAEHGQSAVGRFYLLCLYTRRRRDDLAKEDSAVMVANYTDQFVKVEGHTPLI